jgi:hypothetical protein
MRALRKGLTAGLKESVEWASAAATDLRRSAAGGAPSAAGAPPPLPPAEEEPWEADCEEGGEGGEDEAGAAAHFVIEVLHADGLGSRASFVALCLSDARGALKGRRECTTVRAHASDPVWNSVRDLGAPTAEGDVLLVELYAPDWSRVVGAAHVAAGALVEGGAALTLPLRRLLDPRSCGGAAPGGGSGVVTLRRLRWDASCYASKTVFLVRHGQSRWNEAQRARRLDAMVAFDHPLTRAGAHQAAALRDRWHAAAAAVPGCGVPPATDPVTHFDDTPLPPQPACVDLLGLDLGPLAPPLPPPPPLPPHAPVRSGGSSGDLLLGSAGGGAAGGSGDFDDAEYVPLGATPDVGAGDGDAGWLAAFYAARFVASSPLTRGAHTRDARSQGITLSKAESPALRRFLF